MKKYFVYLMMALAAVTFNACSDDDPLQKNRKQNSPETKMTMKEQKIRMNRIRPTNHRATVTTFLWHTSAGAEPHSGWHNRLSNKPELTCSA